MPLSLQHRHAVLLADRTRDVRTITTVVTEVLAANPETTPLDIETALRAAAGQAYLVANSTTAGFEIVLGMPAWHSALADAGVTVEQNWAALSKVQSVDQRMRLKCGVGFRQLRTCRRTRPGQLSATCGRLRVEKDFLHVCSIGRCSHVFSL